MDKWRTPEAAEYRKLYKRPEWQRLREHALLRDHFTCQRCKCMLKRGKAHNQSAVVHHRTPHKGNLDLFFDIDNLISVCKACHDGPIQSEEVRGYSTEIGKDGWPVDDRHPGVGMQTGGVGK